MIIRTYHWPLDNSNSNGTHPYEYDGSGAELASYVLGGTELVSQTQSGTTSYYLQDGQGSTRALTDSSGVVTDTYSYTAFGELFAQTGTTENSYLYTGQQFDSLTGLYDLRARYYNPAMGRFLSQDTYPYNFGNPVELNRYGYVGNNPINLTDPTGDTATIEYAIRLGAIGAVTGGVSAYACGKDVVKGIIWGGLFGAGFGVGLVYAYQPVLAIGTLASLGGAASSYYDGSTNGWNACNGLSFAVSLISVVLGGSGLVKDISARGFSSTGSPIILAQRPGYDGPGEGWNNREPGNLEPGYYGKL